MDSNIIFPELPTYTGVPTLAGLLSLAVTFLLPVIAALFMRTTWSPFARGLVLLAVAAVKVFLEAFLVAADAGVDFNFVTAAYTVVVQFTMAVVVHFGLLRGTDLQQAALRGGVVKGTPRHRSLE